MRRAGHTQVPAALFRRNSLYTGSGPVRRYVKSEWQVAGVISEFRGVWGLPLTCESDVRERPV